ncbi:MAG: hypothetical protein A2X23_05375 [Chloroflexi bacterium GWC2_73_18]|nr:MAG: hypothetical protein A2X23_05375 [Chloroflexi bacterium GWC2_73_18]
MTGPGTPPRVSARPRRGIRVAVIDDNPHLGWEGRVYPTDATFHRFVAAILDVEGAPVGHIDHCVPLRAATARPATLPLDPRIHVVPTAPFDGIRGYLLRAPIMTVRNAPRLRRAIARADLVWLKMPASNGPLAALLAALSGTPRFGYVAGSARDVVAQQDRSGLEGLVAGIAAAAYDAAARLVTLGGGRSLRVGEGLLAGSGVVTSTVDPEEVRGPSDAPWPASADRLRLAWAGRLVAGKGLETLLQAVALLAADPPAGRSTELLVLGDGPRRGELAGLAERLAIADRVRWQGHVADRPAYRAVLASADLFVFPSPAEGFAKVVLEAMATGLPVIAAPAGALRQLVEAGLAAGVPAGDPEAIAATVRALAGDPRRAVAMGRAGSAFAARHTRQAEAARLVAIWREAYPELPWP